MIEDKLRALEKNSSKLNSGQVERDLLQQAAINYANQFYESQVDEKAYRSFTASVQQILDEPIPEDPGDADSILEYIKNRVVRPGLNTASGRHFGYIPGGGLASSAVGDFLAAVTNRYAGVYASSPGAVLIETRLVNWLCELMGYDKGSGGYLSSGGSHANLTAVVTARDDAGLKATDYSKAVVYLTRQTHHCVDRALNIAGLKESYRHYIPMDDKFRMMPKELEKSISKDREKGLIPWLVVASAGSTDTGAVDPLDTVGDIAKENRLWYHVDGAYGGFFILIESGKTKLRGIDKSDSIVIDPHKGLFLPYGTGALIVKDLKKLAETFQFKANYMKDADVKSGIYSPAEISPELSKHFRGLRMWLPLKLHGIGRFRDALEEKQLLAEYAWQQMQSLDEIETGPEPQLSIFVFRWVPEKGNVNQQNRLLHKALLKEGQFFLSTTEINGKFWFRVAILSVRTHQMEVDQLITEIQNKISELKTGTGYSNPR